VSGVIRNDRQWLRGKKRLAAAKKSRSIAVIAGRLICPTEDGQFVPQYGDFQLFEIRRAPAPDGQRQDTTK
jgi:hypothetical protein